MVYSARIITLLSMLSVVGTVLPDDSSMDTIKLGIFNLKPWHSNESGHHQGIAYDLFKALCDTQGLTMSVKVIPPKRLSTELTLGNIDASFFVYLPELDQSNEIGSAILGQEDVFFLELGAFAMKAKNLGQLSPSQLTQYRIGTALTHNNYFRSLEIKPNEYSSAKSLVKSLYAGRIDLAFAATATLDIEARELQIQDKVETVFRFDKLRPIRLIWSQTSGIKDSTHIANNFDKAIRDLRASGQIDSIIEQYTSKQYVRSIAPQ